MTHKKNFFIKAITALLAVAPIVSFSNCGKDEDKKEPYIPVKPVVQKSVHDVYVSLSYDNGPGSLNHAGYYHDGNLITLSGQADNADTYANSIYVDGYDVYVAGMESDDFGSTAVYWKNGEVNYLPQGSVASGIVVKNGNVYICGHEATMSGDVACCWINNKRYLLDNGTRTAGISVDEAGHVYIVGYYMDRTTYVCSMRYWTDSETGEISRYGINSKGSCEGRAVCLDYSHMKNGHPFICLAGMQSSASGITNKQWVERRETALATASGNEVTSMSACNGKLYTCGNDVKTAKYWVTTIGSAGEGLGLTAKALTDGTSQWKATGISVVEDDVYVVGYESKRTTTPKVWKNGELFFSLDGNVRMTPNAISVVTRQEIVDPTDTTMVKSTASVIE